MAACTAARIPILLSLCERLFRSGEFESNGLLPAMNGIDAGHGNPRRPKGLAGSVTMRQGLAQTALPYPSEMPTSAPAP